VSNILENDNIEEYEVDKHDLNKEDNIKHNVQSDVAPKEKTVLSRDEFWQSALMEKNGEWTEADGVARMSDAATTRLQSFLDITLQRVTELAESQEVF